MPQKNWREGLDGDLLAPGPIREMRLDLTTRCNLRCVYCHVSQLNYRGVDMDRDIVSRSIRLVREVTRHNAVHTITINSGRETTFLEGWTDICRDLLALGLPIGITTNLAREYSQDELDVLGRIRNITISIDTSDRYLLRKIRRRVDLRQIVTNVSLIRAAAVRQSHRLPDISSLCGLYDKNSLDFERFAEFAVALRVTAVGFWDLLKYKYDNTNAPIDDWPRPLHELTDDELRPRMAAIARGFTILARNGVRVNVHGDFVQKLAARVGQHV